MAKKSKEDKELEEKLKIKRVINKMNAYLDDLEPQKQKLIEKAKKARLTGATSQENIARSALKQVMLQQRMVDQMLLTFELTAQIKDLNELSGDFMRGMSEVSKEMGKSVDKINFKAVSKDFVKAISKSRSQSEKMTEFMEHINETFDVAVSDTASVADSEIDMLLNNSLSSEADELDAEIERSLGAVRSNIKDQDKIGR